MRVTTSEVKLQGPYRPATLDVLVLVALDDVLADVDDVLVIVPVDVDLAACTCSTAQPAGNCPKSNLGVSHSQQTQKPPKPQPLCGR